MSEVPAAPEAPGPVAETTPLSAPSEYGPALDRLLAPSYRHGSSLLTGRYPARTTSCCPSSLSAKRMN